MVSSTIAGPNHLILLFGAPPPTPPPHYCLNILSKPESAKRNHKEQGKEVTLPFCGILHPPCPGANCEEQGWKSESSLVSEGRSLWEAAPLGRESGSNKRDDRLGTVWWLMCCLLQYKWLVFGKWQMRESTSTDLNDFQVSLVEESHGWLRSWLAGGVIGGSSKGMRSTRGRLFN